MDKIVRYQKWQGYSNEICFPDRYGVSIAVGNAMHCVSYSLNEDIK